MFKYINIFSLGFNQKNRKKVESRKEACVIDFLFISH